MGNVARYTQDIMRQFQNSGVALVNFAQQGLTESVARSRLQNAANRLGVKISTLSKSGVVRAAVIGGGPLNATPLPEPTYGHEERIKTLESVLRLREDESEAAFLRRDESAVLNAEWRLKCAIVDHVRAQLIEAMEAAAH